MWKFSDLLVDVVCFWDERKIIASSAASPASRRIAPNTDTVVQSGEHEKLPQFFVLQ
jgi:hypothetical protein